MKLAEDAIKKAESNIRIPTLKSDAQLSLMRFAHRQYGTLSRGIGLPALLLSAILTVRNKDSPKHVIEKAKRTIAYETDRKGLAGDTYAEDVYKSRIRPTLDKIVSQNAIDPNDMRGRNSLRNLAEMEVRYNQHLENIDSLRSRGIKLVVCSVHADCSDRCHGLQGRVYSLDGTSGTTADGRKYVPLERATDIYYTTKSGRTYKNGLLGFGCRHVLQEFREGMIIPTVSKAQQKQEYEITGRQRTLERHVRHWDVRAETYRHIDKGEYRKAKSRADYWESMYKDYSRKHKRAFYPSRISV